MKLNNLLVTLLFLLPTLYAESESWKLLTITTTAVQKGQLLIYEKDNVPYILTSPNYADLAPYITRSLIVPCMELFYIFDTIQNQAFTNSSIGYFHVNTSKAHYLLTKRALRDAKQLDRFIFVMRHINAPLSVAGSIDTVIDGKPLTLDGGFVLPQFAVFGIGRYQHYVSSHSSILTTTNWRDYSISQPKVIVKGHSLSQAFCITVNDEQVYLFLLHMPHSVKQPTKKLGVLNDEVTKTLPLGTELPNPKLKELESIFRAEDTKPEKK